MANLVGMDRCEAEAIYEPGREACVEFLVGLSDGVGKLKALVDRSGGQPSRTSQNSSVAPSADQPKTRAQ